MRSEIRLCDLKQWLPWRYIRRKNGKLGKPPIDHRTGELLEKEDGQEKIDTGAFMTYADAVAYARENNLPAVGFYLTEGDPFCCIDLDDCIASGVLSPLATEIMTKHQTYVELSPSKTGAHIWLKTDCKVNLNRKDIGIEIYTHDQFITFTGDRWPTAPNRIAWADLGWLLERYQRTPEPEAPKPPPVAINAPLPDDDRLWRLIWKNDRTTRAERLYNGDLSVVGGDCSHGVIVLLNTLAKFTRGDRPRMARMMGQTKLPPERLYEKRRGGITWLDHQIENACQYMGV